VISVPAAASLTMTAANALASSCRVNLRPATTEIPSTLKQPIAAVSTDPQPVSRDWNDAGVVAPIWSR